MWSLREKTIKTTVLDYNKLESRDTIAISRHKSETSGKKTIKKTTTSLTQEIMWLYLDTDEKPQDKTIKIHEMSTALASALIDSANGDNNSSEIEIEGVGLLNEDQYWGLIQLQNVQPPGEQDVSPRNGIVISSSDTTSASPLPVQR